MLFSLWVFIPGPSHAEVLKTDTVWKGEIHMTEDIIVPEGVRLTIVPGTKITVVPSESTRTDPEYVSPLAEITVRGSLDASGTGEMPVLFHAEGDLPRSWAGILVDGGTASLKFCTVRNADTAIHVLKGSARISDAVLNDNKYGLIAQGSESAVFVEDTLFTGNDYGLFVFGSADVSTRNIRHSENRKKDTFSFPAAGISARKEYASSDGEISRQYREEAFPGDTLWRGRIVIDGVIRIPEGGRLIIMPGTIIEFRKRDANGDGIGENGLLIQGLLIAKGTKESPVIFRSAESGRKAGDWDAINIMNSESAQNIIEYCQVEDAYRGLHFHFSRVAVMNSVFRNNLRGIQFQESLAEIRGNHFYRNSSAVQARDSEIVFDGNDLYGNRSGANFFRVFLSAKGNRISGNAGEGLRIREGNSLVAGNIISMNRFGLMISDAFFGRFIGNIITGNAEAGISLRDTDAVELEGNYVQGNGLNGINIQNSAPVVSRNNISGNGERGLGIITSAGNITGNSIVGNGLFAAEVEGPADVQATGNWWGHSDAGGVLYDGDDEKGRGKILWLPAASGAVPFEWPSDSVLSDVTWYGAIRIQQHVTVDSGATLTVAPGTEVLFSDGAGLRVRGRIIADGDQGRRIAFTSSHRGDSVPGTWDEILVEHAAGSTFSDCDFSGASWAIHSHFTDLTVDSCRFSGNVGGIRFRGGPLRIARSVFEENSIGIRAYRGNAVIEENVITGNEHGIFVREKGGGLTIRRNNLSRNSSYNIRVGDFNTEDVNAPENWWGSGNPAETIFDDAEEPGIGKVIYEPFSGEPFPLQPVPVKKETTR